jgi:hypothetical protein
MVDALRQVQPAYAQLRTPPAARERLDGHGRRLLSEGARMKCRVCDAGGRIERPGMSIERDSTIELALNILGRWRSCDNGHRWKTYELDAGELSELRRRAHLYERLVGSATATQPSHETETAT